MPCKRLLLSCASFSGWLAGPVGAIIVLASTEAPSMTTHTGLVTEYEGWGMWKMWVDLSPKCCFRRGTCVGLNKIVS